MLGSLARLPRLQFDFNPLHLRSAKVESVATLLDLVRDSTTTPNSIDVLAPSLAGAAALAERLAQLAEIDHAVTLASFVPDGQDEKLALIRDAVLLEPALNPGQTAPQPSDAEDVRAMERATRSLERAAVDHSGEVAVPAVTHFAQALRTVAQGEPTRRERVRVLLIPGLVATLGQLRAAMQAGR